MIEIFHNQVTIVHRAASFKAKLAVECPSTIQYAFSIENFRVSSAALHCSWSNASFHATPFRRHTKSRQGPSSLNEVSFRFSSQHMLNRIMLATGITPILSIIYKDHCGAENNSVPGDSNKKAWRENRVASHHCTHFILCLAWLFCRSSAYNCIVQTSNIYDVYKVTNMCIEYLYIFVRIVNFSSKGTIPLRFYVFSRCVELHEYESFAAIITIIEILH